MKRLLVGLTLFISVFVLSGCDELLGGDKEQTETNLWFDEEMQEIHVSYKLPEPAEDEVTGIVPSESIHLMMYNELLGEWEDVYQFTGYQVDDEIIQYNYTIYGDVRFKIAVLDETGVTRIDTGDFSIYVNEPQFIYHFDTWFDSNSGLLQFNFGVNEFSTSYLVIEKSGDGGLTWEEIIEAELVMADDGFVKNQLQYYEFEEGNYVFRMSAYDELGVLLQEMNSWGEINVSFENQMFEGIPELWQVSGNFDTYSKTVNLWWDASGDFEGFLVEKSMDQENWELVAELPRIAQSFSYEELIDGLYFYRLSAMDDDSVVLSIQSEDSVRVKQDALLGGFNGWFDWESNSVNLDWQFMNDNVASVLLERKTLDTEFELIGEFGPLKTMHEDENLAPGTYVYRVVLLNDLGEELDSLESMEFEIKAPEHVYSLNAWHNQSTGEVEFNFGFNQYYVTSYMIEKSSDGGLTWVVVLDEETVLDDGNWYKDYVRLYELEEGVYTYRITGYDELGNTMGQAVCWNEVMVSYDNLNLDEPTEIYYIDGNQNIYDNSIYLWWGSQGSYTSHIISYTTDQVTFTEYVEVPRVTSSLQITNLPDGNYYFKIEAVNELGEVVDEQVTEYYIRVKENSKIGNFEGYYNWNGEVHVYWDIIKDDVAMIRIERRLETEVEFDLTLEYGALKTALLDEITETGNYIYQLTLLDTDGNIIDQMESNVIEVVIYEEPTAD